jgi:hypothetical protein
VHSAQPSLLLSKTSSSERPLLFHRLPVTLTPVTFVLSRMSYDRGSVVKGLSRLPVTEEIAGSNPVGSARKKDSSKDESFFLTAHSAKLTLAYFYDTIYFMSEQLHLQKPFTPADMAALLINKGIAAGAIINRSTEAPTQDQEAEAPYEGMVTQINGQDYRYVAATASIYNRATGTYDQKPLTLRTWFSHSTPEEGIDMGPGWDFRFGLHDLTPDQQMARYGHVFSPDEIRNPRLMPDIPYFELEPVESEPRDSGLPN